MKNILLLILLAFTCISSVAQKVLVENGYVVISTEGLYPSCRANRVGDNTFFDQKRVARHYIKDMNGPNGKVSAKFRVSPTDVAVDGSTDNAKVILGGTWAEFAGWSTNANSLHPDNESVLTADTGCYMYKGKDGSDEVGSWRLPTQKELFLILMYDMVMQKKNVMTGYVKLTDLHTSYYYVSASEIAGWGQPNEFRCGVINTYKRVSDSYYKNNSSSRFFRARCVRDL